MDNQPEKTPLPFEQPKGTILQTIRSSEERKPLTTKDAVKFLLDGNLKSRVCRYCLNVASLLSEVDQILQVANSGTFYKVTVKDMIASFHPFKIADDPNFPDKICNKCLDRAISSYLFTQQCEQAERALRNCFDDIHEKLIKLDPLERSKKRGRQKLKPNFNIIHAEHGKVMNYADPIIHIVNTASEPMTAQDPINECECLKCCEILPNLESLLNHTRIHPKSMWYNCRLCGTSFPKLYRLKRHFRNDHKSKAKLETMENVTKFECKTCGFVSVKYYDYLQHVETHKFKTVMEHLLAKKMDKLCAVCLNKGRDMVPLDGTICLHGGCPELTGDRSLYNVLASTLPEMSILDNYTGTKICEKCLSHAITSYIFINHTQYVRNRLSTCVSAMSENLNKMTEWNTNICIEIAQSAIMKVTEPFEETVFDETDETKFRVEVLEDEFRLQSDEEIETETESYKSKHKSFDTPNYNGKDKVTNNTIFNGFKFENANCRKLLSLKKKPKFQRPKFTCPLCRKHFISDYFLKRHILKHVPNKVECNICNLQFKSKFDLYEHKKITHILNRNFYLSCEICGRCYNNEEKLKYHVRLHSNQLCQLCDKKFKSQNSYNCHMLRHINKLGLIMEKYKQNCSFCEKNCPNDNEFSLHVNKVHLQMKPYSCDMCERYFYTDYNLKSHKKLHSIRSKEQCRFCNKFLNSRKQLVIHIRKHIGDTPFCCQICKQSFHSQSKLWKHMKISHGGRYCCKFCKTTYVTNKNLKEHVSKVHNSLF